jgi:hypothetical protein
VGPLVAKSEDSAKEESKEVNLPEPEPEPVPDLPEPEPKVEASRIPYYSDLGNEYFDVEGKTVHARVLKDLYPEVYADNQRKKLQVELGLKADNTSTVETKTKASFGIQFPDSQVKGDMFLHVGTLPSRLFKYNGNNWIQVDKSMADSYTYDEDYLKYLVDHLNKGIISAEDLTDSEQDQIENYLKKNV